MGRREKDSEPHGHRHERLQRLIFEELNALLRDEVSDPLLADVECSAVELSIDYKNVRARFLLTDADATTQAVQAVEHALERASSFLKRGLSDALDLKRVPNLRFIYDRERAAERRALALIDAQKPKP